MRAYSVIAAGFCFFAVVAPHPGAAQVPTAKAAAGVIKQTHRLVWVTGEGAKIDPPYKFHFGKRLGLEVGKLPGKTAIAFGSGAGVAAWWCDLIGLLCPKQK